MVSLSTIRAANARLLETLPPNLVSLFVGGTSGIGEATLLELASHSRKPKIYIAARRAEGGERVVAAAQKLNPGGEYVFVQSDAGSMKETEKLAAYILAREERLDMMFLSAGLPLVGKESAAPFFFPPHYFPFFPLLCRTPFFFPSHLPSDINVTNFPNKKPPKAYMPS